MTITHSGILADSPIDSIAVPNRRLLNWILGVCVGLSCLDLLGWAIGFRPFVKLVPTMPAMSTPSALCFLALAASLYFRKTNKSLSILCAKSVYVIDIVAEIFYFIHLGAHAPHTVGRMAMHRMPTNGMSPIVACMTATLAYSILNMDRVPRSERQRIRIFKFQQYAIIVGFVALTSMLAYWFDVLNAPVVRPILGMASASGLLFILFSLAILVSEPKKGVVGAVLSDSISGQTARRLLPVAVVAPFVLGSATKLALQVHAGMGLLLAFLIVIASIVFLAVMTWHNIVTLDSQVQMSEEFQIQLANTDRKKFTIALSSAKGQLALALEGADLGTWNWDLQTGERVWSDQCKKMFGVPLDTEMTLHTLRTCVHPDDRAAMDAARQKSICDTTDYFVEYRVIWPDASIHWIESRGKVTCDSEGKALRFEGISQDVSMRHLIEERQQQFLKDMLASVTDAKLTLCLNQTQLPETYSPVTDPVTITSSNGGIRTLRDAAFDACLAAGLPPERCYDMKTAVAEAAMNSAVHAHVGVGQVFVNEHGTVQVRVLDHGTGIKLENLPNATLKKGYTTAGTLGHGMKMMLQTVDRIYLLTGRNGTTVIVEQDKEQKEIFW